MTDSPAFQHHRYRSSCGRLDLYARDYPGDGPVLLLMHGLTRNSADFEPLVPHLAGRYRLIVPDQRGRGLSGYDDDPANYRPDVYAADMTALLDSLDIASAGLIGTSMGGLMAMLMTAGDPARYPAVVLNDIGSVLDQAGLSRIQGYVGPARPAANWDEAADRCEAINREAFPAFGHDDWMAFARRTCRQAPDGSVGFAYDPAISESVKGDEPGTVPPNLWPLWDMMTAAPVLVVRGALSDLLSAATVQEMATRHDGPFAAIEVAGRGHAPLLDEPEALSAILPFLKDYVG